MSNTSDSQSNDSQSNEKQSNEKQSNEKQSNEKVVSVSRVIAAAPETIFDLLADPKSHHLFDGSGSVMGSRGGNPERLSMGAKFGMDMKLGIPYRITSEVVEFEENRVIAWRHLGHHVWRYELEPVEGGTKVTESFNWGVARFPPFYEWVGYPARHTENMTKTLERLNAHLTSA